MTTGRCTLCGSPLTPGGRFCGVCGARITDSVPAPAQGGPAAPRPDPSVPRPGQPPAGPAAPGPGSPWAGPATGAAGAGTGDWPAALVAAGFATATAIAVAMLGVLLLSGGDAGPAALAFGTGLFTVLALGGDVVARLDAGLVAGQVAVSGRPLMPTLAAAVILGALYLRRVRSLESPRRVAAQAARTVVALVALAALLALGTRIAGGLDDPGILVLSGSLAGGLLSTVAGAAVLGTVSLAAALALRRPDVLPARLRRVRDAAVTPVRLAALLPAGGLLIALALAVVDLATGSDRAAQLGLYLLALPNVAVATLLLALGVPLRATGTGGPLWGLVQASDGTSVTLTTLTAESAWFWLAPVVAVTALLAAAAIATRRQPTPGAGAGAGLRLAAALAVTAVALAALTRLEAEAGGALAGDESSEFSLSFHPLVAGLVVGAWGAAAAVGVAVAGPRLLAALRSGLRSGASTTPATPVAAAGGARPTWGPAAMGPGADRSPGAEAATWDADPDAPVTPLDSGGGRAHLSPDDAPWGEEEDLWPGDDPAGPPHDGTKAAGSVAGHERADQERADATPLPSAAPAGGDGDGARAGSGRGWAPPPRATPAPGGSAAATRGSTRLDPDDGWPAPGDRPASAGNGATPADALPTPDEDWPAPEDDWPVPDSGGRHGRGVDSDTPGSHGGGDGH